MVKLKRRVEIWERGIGGKDLAKPCFDSVDKEGSWKESVARALAFNVDGVWEVGDHHIIQIKLSFESEDGIMYLLRCQPLTPKRLVGRSLMELAEKWMRFLLCFSDSDVVGYVAGVQGLSFCGRQKTWRLRSS
ncbi:hypothetical protein NC652_023175 [Populus alba x Populus x berolinensis]|nr:hypothetical protein NC652_023175 [Populus alba x Populus x berolinensis]